MRFALRHQYMSLVDLSSENIYPMTDMYRPFDVT